ncbi:neprilysin-1-like [Ornithodoros turicata]|uniref:neprilysin-1-like n=1 Tax=Ornithodoros turicata TaxID=34597 RepID=UPI0031396C9C
MGARIWLPHNLSFSNAALNGTNGSLNTRKHMHGVCSTSFCLREGDYLKALLSWNVDPCENFYRFACTRWKGTLKLAEQGSAATVDEAQINLLESKVKSLLDQDNIPGELASFKGIFDECMNASNIESADWAPISELLWLVTLDGFPYSSTPKNGSSVWKVAARVLRIAGTETLLNVWAATHPKKTGGVVAVGAPAILSPYTTSGDSNTTSFYNASAYAAIAALNKHNKQRNHWVYAQEVAQFASRLEGFAFNQSRLIGPNAHRTGTLRDLPELFTFLTSLFAGSEGIDYNGSNTEVLIESSVFLSQLLNLVRNTEPYIVLNYLGVRLMLEMSAFLPMSAKDLKEGLVGAIYRKQRPQVPQWNLCLRVVERASPALFLYATRVTNLHDSLNSDSIMHLLGALRSELMKSLNYSAVLDVESKQRANRLLSQSRFLLLYPPWLSDIAQVDEFQRVLPRVVPGQGLQAFYSLRAKSFFESLRKGPENRWLGSAFDTDCRHSDNTVFVPALLFNISLAAHENSTVFQLPQSGIRVMRCLLNMVLHAVWVDSGTSPRRWWPDLANSFLRNSQLCLQQYALDRIDATKLLETSMALKPVFDKYDAEISSDTKFENFQTYDARRLFFVYYSMGFCSGGSSSSISEAENLVNVPLWNYRSFQETYHCPVGSSMNPERKCVLWQETP